MGSMRVGTDGRRAQPPGRRWRTLALRLALVLLVGFAGILTVAFVDANLRFAFLPDGSPARIYSAPFTLTPGLAIERADLEERLARLGYRKGKGHPATPGEFTRRLRGYDINLNAFDYPDGRFDATLVRLRISFGRVAGIENAATGQDLQAVRIEPEPLGLLSGDVNEDRIPVALEDLPKWLPEAVIAVEDRRFKHHFGVDPRAVLRAFFANVKRGEVVQGGSTITQQLAKNLYANVTERTWTRKIWETLAAFGIEAFRGKPEILERYLNQIYLAQRGPISIIGIGAASRHYFGKDARYLDLDESALLAGLIQSPGRYHPYRNPQAALERRNLVLRLMRDERFITDDAYREAAARPLGLRNEPPADVRQAPNFVEYVADELKRLGLREPGSHPRLRVFTTLDPLLQARATSILETSLRNFEQGYRQLRPLPGGELQGAIVSLRPSDGSVLAMVGGRNYQRSQFNRVTQAHRQPGSLFKPFVYLAGFYKSQDAGDSNFTPATVLDDSPLVMEVADQVWEPKNFDLEFRGPVTARHALAFSLNVPTIRAAEMIGLKQVIWMARRCGITSSLMAVPSLALGTFEVTPLEMASAYATIANLGTRTEPRVIDAVLDEGGTAVALPAPTSSKAASPQAAYLTVDLMRDVIRYGTGAGLHDYGVKGEIAGKTGTTDDGRDAWFVAFNPDLLVLSWVGFDNNRPLRLGGSALALPICGQFLARSGLDEGRSWEKPEGLVDEEVDPTTGLIAGWRCPESVDEIFIQGTQPTESCDHEGRGYDSWVSRFFNWFRRD